nr:tripartite tricarboxylate transporter TctB family protein [Microvirga antarctica]
MNDAYRSQPSAPTMQILVALTLLAGCSLYLYAAMGFSFGVWSSPKAGFIPRIAGCLGVTLAACNVARVWWTAKPGPVDLGLSPRRAFAFLGVLVAYVALLGKLGFLPVTFAATLALLLVSRGRRGLVMTLTIAGAFSVGIWLLFGSILNLPLP